MKSRFLQKLVDPKACESFLKMAAPRCSSGGEIKHHKSQLIVPTFPREFALQSLDRQNDPSPTAFRRDDEED